MNWKICKYCGDILGNCLKNCKGCNNDRFWGIPHKHKTKKPEFNMTEQIVPKARCHEENK